MIIFKNNRLLTQLNANKTIEADIISLRNTEKMPFIGGNKIINEYRAPMNAPNISLFRTGFKFKILATDKSKK